jgi:predicted glycogen debranching enzyme
MISFDSSVCGDYEAATSREWLETNGIGGFASGTISGSNTRRYHGLLTAATRPPLGRITTVSRFLERLIIGNESHELSACRFSGTLDAEACQYISQFRLDPFPIWTFTVGDVVLEKKLFMPNGSNATVVTYSVLGDPKGALLEIKPLLAFVDYHHLQHEDPKFQIAFRSRDAVASVRPYPEMPEVYFLHNAAAIDPTGVWYKSFEYTIEQERGFDSQEDLFQPFLMRFDFQRPAKVIVTTEQSILPSDQLEKDEIERRSGLVKTAKATDETRQILTLAADQFIVKRGSGHTVIAGYPWFSDWGPRHNDLVARTDAIDKSAPGRPRDHPRIFKAYLRGNASKPFSRRGRRGGVQHGRRNALVFRGDPRIFGGERRLRNSSREVIREAFTRYRCACSRDTIQDPR